MGYRRIEFEGLFFTWQLRFCTTVFFSIKKIIIIIISVIIGSDKIL